MGASPLVQKIAQASKDSWPQVTAALTQSTRTMAELAGISEEVIPQVEEYVARGTGASLRRRKVCEETIWVLASLGWLRTGGERAVILAAKGVAIGHDDDSITDDEFMALEDVLVEAVQSLPEYMTTKES